MRQIGCFKCLEQKILPLDLFQAANIDDVEAGMVFLACYISIVPKVDPVVDNVNPAGLYSIIQQDFFKTGSDGEDTIGPA